VLNKSFAVNYGGTKQVELDFLFALQLQTVRSNREITKVTIRERKSRGSSEQVSKLATLSALKLTWIGGARGLRRVKANTTEGAE
jgi:hypothetical protein